MEAFRVRAARMEDVAGVVALDRATELLPHWAESHYSDAVTHSDGEGVRRCLFVAEAGELVGFAAGMVAGVGQHVIAELESVAVANAARRMGVAKALCGAITRWARELGASEMELEVRSRSVGAILLYQGLGFTTVGRRTGYYRSPEDDAVQMRLSLETLSTGSSLSSDEH